MDKKFTVHEVTGDASILDLTFAGEFRRTILTRNGMYKIIVVCEEKDGVVSA